MNKTIMLFALLISVVTFGYSQTEGKIIYKETLKLDIQIDGLDESMKDMIPQSQSLDKELFFNSTESLYQNKKGESLEGMDLSSDDGSFQIKIMVDDTEDIYYKSFDKNEKVHQRGMMGKSFVVKDELSKHKWKITGEKIKFMDYECLKAVIETDEDFIVAWFAPQIPVQAGPADLHGLPGLILMANYNDGETEIQAQNIDFRALEKGEMKIPNDGKKVNEEEYERIFEEKQQEMREMYGEDMIIKERR